MNGTEGERSASAPPTRPVGGGLAGSLLAHPKFGPLPGLLLILTAVTGVVDAVSILSLGRVFVANMTGNVVFAGFAAVGAPGFSLSASLFALAGFLLGAALGGGLITWAGRDRGLLLRAGTGADFRAVLRERGRVDRGDRTALSDLGRRLLVVATMLAGAVAAGWLVLNLSPLAALILGTALLALAFIGAALATSRPGQWRQAPPPPAPVGR